MYKFPLIADGRDNLEGSNLYTSTKSGEGGYFGTQLCKEIGNHHAGVGDDR